MAIIVSSTDPSRQLRQAMKTLVNSRQSQAALQKLAHQNNAAAAAASIQLPTSPVCQKQQQQQIPLSLSIPEAQQTSPWSLKSPLSPIVITSADRTVRICQLHEYKHVALSLAHAFADDPCALFFINTPDRAHWSPRQKWQLHLEIMEYMVYAHMLDGIVTTVGTGYGAVALWMPPGKDTDSYSTTFRSGLWRLHYRLSRQGHARWFNDFMPLLHDTKHSVLAERDCNSWYLVYLGTRPGARRRGLARALIENITAVADEQQVPVYLESSKAMNVPIYAKFGFQCATRVHMGALLAAASDNGGSSGVDEQLSVAKHEQVPLDIMVREPVTIKLRVN